MKEKALGIFSEIKYGLAVFVLLSAQAIMNMIPFQGTGEFLHVYYLVDFSMGKASRLLIGTLVNWLTDAPTPEWVDRFFVVSLFLTILLASVLAGKVINNTKKELKPHILVFALFLVSGSLNFACFSKFTGFFDIYMFAVALLCVVFLFNKYLRWLVPVLCVAGVFIHQGFALSFFPLVIGAAFYMAFTNENKAAKKAVFVVSAVATVATVLYCVSYGTDTMTITFEEMCAIVEERAGIDISDDALFNLGFYFYNHVPSGTELSIYEYSDLSLWDTLAEIFIYTNSTYLTSFNGLISIMSLAVIMFAAFWIIWIKCAKNSQTKGRKFLYICFMLATLIVPLYCLIAVDYIRWVQAGMLTQFGLAFMMFYTKDEPFEKAVAELGEFFRKKKLLLVIIYFVYALSVKRDLSA